MKKDNVIITALSVGIVVVVAVTAFFLFQNSKKVTDATESTTEASAVTTQAATVPAVTESTVPATQPHETTAAENLKPTKTQKETKDDNTATPSPSPDAGIADGTYNAFVTEASINVTDNKSQGTVSVQPAKIYMG